MPSDSERPSFESDNSEKAVSIEVGSALGYHRQIAANPPLPSPPRKRGTLPELPPSVRSSHGLGSEEVYAIDEGDMKLVSERTSVDNSPPMGSPTNKRNSLTATPQQEKQGIAAKAKIVEPPTLAKMQYKRSKSVYPLDRRQRSFKKIEELRKSLTGYAKKQPPSHEQVFDWSIMKAWENHNLNEKTVVEIETTENREKATKRTLASKADEYPPNSLDPVGRLYSTWSKFIVAVFFWIAIRVPVQIAFFDGQFGVFFALDYVCDLVFIADLVIQLLLRRTENGRTFPTRKATFRYYARRGFIMDVITILPIDLVFLTAFGTGPLTLFVLPYLRLNRLFKAQRFIEWFSGLQKDLKINVSIVRLIKSLVLLFIGSHWIACAWYVMEATQNFQGFENGWDRDQIESFPSQSTLTRLLRSYLWSISTLTGLGQNDYYPQTSTELTFQMIIVIIGILVYASFVGNFATILSNESTAANEFRQQFSKIKHYLAYRKIPEVLVDRILGFYNHMWSKHKGIDENTVLNDLPASLQAEIRLQFLTGAVYSVTESLVPRRIIHNVAAAIIVSLQTEFHNMGEIVQYVGLYCHSTLFIQSGSCVVLHFSKEKKSKQTLAEELRTRYIEESSSPRRRAASKGTVSRSTKGETATEYMEDVAKSEPTSNDDGGGLIRQMFRRLVHPESANAQAEAHPEYIKSAAEQLIKANVPDPIWARDLDAIFPPLYSIRDLKTSQQRISTGGVQALDPRLQCCLTKQQKLVNGGSFGGESIISPFLCKAMVISIGYTDVLVCRRERLLRALECIPYSVYKRDNVDGHTSKRLLMEKLDGVVGRGPRIQAETTYTRRLLKRWVSLRGLRMNDDTFAKQSARVLPSERLVIAVFKLKIWLQRMRLEDRGIFRKKNRKSRWKVVQNATSFLRIVGKGSQRTKAETKEAQKNGVLSRLSRVFSRKKLNDDGQVRNNSIMEVEDVE